MERMAGDMEDYLVLTPTKRVHRRLDRKRAVRGIRNCQGLR